MKSLPSTLFIVKKTVSEIISSGNHYIIQVKGNQKNLYEQIRLNTQDDKKAISSWETNETKRGRQERRKVFVYKDITGISPEWKGLQRLIRVERYVTVGDKKRHETAYYISSIKEDDAQYFGIHIRNHWGIENRLHWVKDVSMKEDTSKTARGMAAENISILRNITINIFRLNGFDSIKYATQFYANNFKKLWRLVSGKIVNKIQFNNSIHHSTLYTQLARLNIRIKRLSINYLTCIYSLFFVSLLHKTEHFNTIRQADLW